jgi:hypothetical protein
MQVTMTGQANQLLQLLTKVLCQAHQCMNHSMVRLLLRHREAIFVIYLRIDRWPILFDHAEAGLVSYPLLLGPDGTKRTMPSQWLANRSFVGVDNQGRVIIGTTQSAFFFV